MHSRQVCLVSVFLQGIPTEAITHGDDTDYAAVQSVFLEKKRQLFPSPSLVSLGLFLCEETRLYVYIRELIEQNSCRQ